VSVWFEISNETSGGAYKIEMDAGKLDGGLYIIRLRAGEFVETKKMILLR